MTHHPDWPSLHARINANSTESDYRTPRLGFKQVIQSVRSGDFDLIGTPRKNALKEWTNAAPVLRTGPSSAVLAWLADSSDWIEVAAWGLIAAIVIYALCTLP